MTVKIHYQLYVKTIDIYKQDSLETALMAARKLYKISESNVKL